MRLLQSLRLTDSQKMVLAKIIDAPTPKIASQQLTGNPNLAAATHTLVNLDLVSYSPASALVTQKGMDLMHDENLVDDSGMLTPDGQALAAIGKATTADTQEMNQMNKVESFTLLGQLIR